MNEVATMMCCSANRDSLLPQDQVHGEDTDALPAAGANAPLGRSAEERQRTSTDEGRGPSGRDERNDRQDPGNDKKSRHEQSIKRLLE